MANTKRFKRKPKERVLIESLAQGNLLAATPGFRDHARTAQEWWDEGLSESEVRQRIRSRLDSEGLTLKRQLFPNLSRKVQRIKLRRLLLALADYIAERTPANRLGTALDGLLDRIGFDQWLEDAIWTYATTGEAAPIFESFSGTVQRVDIGPDGDKTPVVMLLATPASDVAALTEWFQEEAQAAFPDETFVKRSGKAAEGARYYRLNQEGYTFERLAHDNITERYPDLLASSNDEEFDHYTWLAEKETERLKKLALRTSRRGDIIFDYKSPVG